MSEYDGHFLEMDARLVHVKLTNSKMSLTFHKEQATEVLDEGRQPSHGGSEHGVRSATWILDGMSFVQLQQATQMPNTNLKDI